MIATLIAAQLPEGRIDDHEPWMPVPRQPERVWRLVVVETPCTGPVSEAAPFVVRVRVSWVKAVYGFLEAA